MSYNTTHTSEDQHAKKQCTAISIEIVDTSNNPTNVKVTATIQSGSDSKREGVGQNNSGQSYVSNVLDIRQGGSQSEKDQNGDLSSTSDLGNLFEVGCTPGGDNTDVIKLIEQGDIEKLMTLYGNGNVQNIAQMLTKIIEESNQELKECSAPGSNLPPNQEKGDVKEEEGEDTKKSSDEGCLKTEEAAPTMTRTAGAATNMNPQMEPPPNMNVSEAFQAQQSLPSIQELKKPTTSAMPPASGFNRTLKVENNIQNVPSGIYPPCNSMPRVPMSSALSGMAASLSGPQSHMLTNAAQPPPTNSIINSINPASNMYQNNGHFNSSTLQPASRLSHRTSVSNFPNPQQSNPSNQLAQILKGQQGTNSFLPNLANNLSNGRPSGIPVNNNAAFLTNNKHYLPQQQRMTQEQFRIMKEKAIRQRLQSQQLQAMNQHIRGPPPPYTKVQPNAPPMNYSSMPGRSMSGALNRALSTGMQGGGINGGIPQDNMNGLVHLGTQPNLQQQSPQMAAQMANQARLRVGGIPGMRQMMPQRSIANRDLVNRQQNISMPARQRIGMRAPGVVRQEQVMPQQQQPQQQPQQMPIHQMRRMVGNTQVGPPVQQQMNTAGHPHVGGNNDPWQNSNNTIQSMNNMPMQTQGINQQQQPGNSSMNQFHGLNSSMQTVVNVQTSQNTSQNINIQTSVQAVLHQPQQSYSTALNNQQRLLHHQQQQQQQQQAALQSRLAQAAPNMTINPPMGMNAGHSNQGMMGTVQMGGGGNLRPPHAVQSSTSIDLELLDNIIRKDT